MIFPHPSPVVKSNHKFTFILPALVMSLIFSGCGTKPCNSDPLNFEIEEKVLTEYNSIANASTPVNATEDIDCYFDYSDGMKDKSVKVSNNYDKLIPFLKGRTTPVHYFKVGASDDLPEITASQADFRNDANYTDKVSKLNPAIAKMAANKNKTSIFITDFERIQGGGYKSNPRAPTPFLKEVDSDPWAQKEFKDWLKAGNQIDIFAMSYTGEGLNNWVYAIIFTPHSIINQENKYKTSLIKYLKENFKGVTHFMYSASKFNISQEKKADEIGNANDNVIVQQNITKTKDRGFEFYQFSAKDLVKFNTDESQKNDKRIINKIKVVSDNESFSEIGYGLKVYDISQSITDYYCAKNNGEIQIDTNAETGKKDTISKPQTYSYQKGNPVDNVFDLVYNVDTKIVGIKLKPDFTGVEKKTMYQLDLIVKDAKLKDFSDEKHTLVLNYSKPDFTISPLASSIQLAMSEIATSIEGKVIYTIYIELDK